MAKVCKPVRELSMYEAIQKLNVSDTPVLVQFRAKWCGACQAATPEVEKAACNIQDDIETVAVDIDDLPSIQQEFGIEDIPTVAVVHKGRIVASTTGAAASRNYSKLARDWLRANGYKGPV